ncbi:MAG: ATP-binding protein [Bacteroidetes bacterium]|nr:ATP-binding protein [Bacteroidota bacterium]
MQSLRLKIGAGYLILVSIGLATSIFALLKFIQLRKQVAPIIRVTYQNALAAENLIRSLDDQEHALLSAVIDDPELYRAYFNDNRDIFINWLVRMKETAPTKFQNSLIDSIIATDSLYNQSAEVLFYYLVEKNDRRLGLKYQKFVLRPIAERLRNQCSRLLEENQAAMMSAEDRIYTITQEAIISMIIAIITSIVLSITTSIRFTRTVIHPAEKLTEIVRKIGQGNLNQKIDITTDDEIGVLSSEFNKMTERLRQYEEMNIHQLLAEKKKTETIVSSISEPVIVLDASGKLILINRAAATLFAINNWENKYPHEVLNDPKLINVLEQYLLPSPPLEQPDYLFSIERNGTTFFYRPHFTHIVDDSGTSLFTVFLFHDVTKFKTLEKMKSDFIATVSHELRTPITSLSMGIDVLLQNIAGTLTPQQHEILSTAKDDIERLRKLTSDLLDLSRFESKQYELQKELVNLSFIVENVSRTLRLQFQQKKIQFQNLIPETLPPVFADSEKLTWVFTNLLNNALRFTNSGGKITINAEKHNDNILVSVEDTGEGIPEEYHESIFDKFVKVKQATDTTPGSVGLGLAIAKEIIEKHNGKIWVKSKLGVGSTFFFTLPLNE